MVAQRTARAAGRADADLPPAAADRLHRRAQRRRGAGRGDRRHCRRRRDRRQRYSDVHRRDDHGSAGGICDPPVRPHGRGAREGRLRNARQQLLDRHSRHAAGRSGLLCRRQRGLRPDDAHKQRCRAGHTPRTAASCVAFRGAGQGAVSQQRRQSRNLLADRHRTGPRNGAVDHVPARNQPRSRIGRTARILAFRPGKCAPVGSGSRDYPVFRRHPRNLFSLHTRPSGADRCRNRGQRRGTAVFLAHRCGRPEASSRCWRWPPKARRSSSCWAS